MVSHECPYCAKSFQVHWTECAWPWLSRGTTQGQYSGPEVFCPHCRKLARFTGSSLARTVAVAIGCLLLPLSVVAAFGLDERRFAVAIAILIGLPVSWTLSAMVCCGMGVLAAFPEQPR